MKEFTHSATLLLGLFLMGHFPSTPVHGGQVTGYYYDGPGFVGISGVNVEDLFPDPSYPDGSTGMFTVPNRPDVPYLDWYDVDNADNYGTRTRGFIIVPQTGDYTFVIASDDSSYLDIAPYNVALPARPAEPSAQEGPDACCTGLFDAVRYAQRSTDAFALNAGDIVTFQVLHKEGDGAAWFQVGWVLPDGTAERIPSLALFPWEPHEADSAITMTEPLQDVTIPEGEPLTLSISVGGKQPLSFEWKRDGLVLGGEILPWLSLGPVSPSDGAQYSITITDGNGASQTSGPISVTVVADATPPTLLSAEGFGTAEKRGLLLKFSEPVSEATALDSANYQFTGQTLSIQQITMPSPDSVLIEFNEALSQASLQVEVSGITDLAATPNLLDPDPTVAAVSFSPPGLNFLFYDTETSSLDQFYPPPRGRGSYPKGAKGPGATTIDASRRSGVIPYFENANTGDIAVAPSGQTELYFGQVIYGYLEPTETADYTFGLSSDDQAELWLSTTEDPNNSVLIASVETWTGVRDYNAPASVSGSFPMVAGQRYYVECVMRQGYGAGHLAVTWNLTGENPAAGSLPIGGEFLRSGWNTGPLSFAVQPRDTQAREGRPVALVVEVLGSDVPAIGYQWFKDGVAVAGATDRSLKFTAATVEDGGEYRVVAYNRNGTHAAVTSEPATLSVTSADPGPSPFSEVTGLNLTGVFSSSVAWGDYDNDGDLDILLTGYTDSGGVSKVYRNDGAGGFVDINAGLTEVEDPSVAWGDYDNDGDLDILLTGFHGTGMGVSKVYRNDGVDGFVDINAGLPGVGASSVAWGDYDNDGDLDILLTGDEELSGTSSLSKVYRNDGADGFVDINAALTGVGLSSVAWGDYDNDGDLDILLAGNDWSVDVSKVYRNDGTGSFMDINAGLTGVRSGSVAWGDYDNDGDLDILLTGFHGTGTPVSKVYRNDGAGSFVDIGAGLTSVIYSSAAWGDYDNDGDLDILLTGSTSSGPVSQVYRNDGPIGFLDIEAGLTGVHAGPVAWGDYDNDGDLDILLTGQDSGNNPVSKVYRNELPIVPLHPGFDSSHPDLRFIEAEDYNYAGGLWKPLANGWPVNPIPSQTYKGLAGDPGVDFSDGGGGPDPYRTGAGPAPGPATIRLATHREKAAFSVFENFKIAYTRPGEWLKYTRDFGPDPGLYEVYARIASNRELIRFELRTEDGSQTAEYYGAGTCGWNEFRLVRLEAPGTQGQPALWSLTGEQTLQLEWLINDADVDYLVLAPVGDVTLATFDSAYDTPWARESSPASVQPTLVNDGPTGNALRLSEQGAFWTGKAITFSQTRAGLNPNGPIVIDFDVRVIGPRPSADGGSLLLLPTGTFGRVGTGLSPDAVYPEEPNYPGVFGIAVDTYYNDDRPGDPDLSDNEISVHWDGQKIAAVAIPPERLNWTSGQFHHVHAELHEVGGQGALRVWLTPDIHGSAGQSFDVFAGEVVIPGFSFYDYRVAFLTRTGGYTQDFDLDNLRVGGWESEDIGSPTERGSLLVEDPVWTVEAGGSDIWYASDAFHFTHRSWAGDFDCRVRVESLEAVSSYSKAGLMARAGTAPDAANLAVIVTPNGATQTGGEGANRIESNLRPLTGHETGRWSFAGGTGSDESSPNGLDDGDGVWLRLRRQGDLFTSFRSEDGLDWAEMATVDLAGFPRLLEVGVATCAQNDEMGKAVTAVYQGFRLAGPATVQGRHLFYNLSAWDNGFPGPDADDDAAIAADKSALLPGGVATFANYSSYSRGLNGIMIDIDGLPGLPDLSDFTFRTGNDNDLTTWATAEDPLSLSVRRGAGVNGSDRITLIWNDNNLDGVNDVNEAVAKAWLEVTVLATANTGLAADHTFYFGNAVGEVGNSANDALVDAIDVYQPYYNQTPGGLAPITSPYDVNRDRTVDAHDVYLPYYHQTGGPTALVSLNLSGAGLISGSGGSGPAVLQVGSPLSQAGMRQLLSEGRIEGWDPETGQPVGGTTAALRLHWSEEGRLLAALEASPGEWRLEWTEDLSAGPWQAVDSGWALEAMGRGWWLDWEGGTSARFYRVVEGRSQAQ